MAIHPISILSHYLKTETVVGVLNQRIRTPPLLRARTCSIVLSACRDDEVEKVLNPPCTPFVPLTPSNALFPLLKVHRAPFFATIREEAAGLELLMDAKARRVEDCAGVRSMGDDRRTLAAPAMQLDVEDILIAVVQMVRIS